MALFHYWTNTNIWIAARLLSIHEQHFVFIIIVFCLNSLNNFFLCLYLCNFCCCFQVPRNWNNRTEKKKWINKKNTNCTVSWWLKSQFIVRWMVVLGNKIYITFFFFFLFNEWKVIYNICFYFWYMITSYAWHNLNEGIC